MLNADTLRALAARHTPRVGISAPRPSAQIHLAASLRLKTCILNPDGRVVSESPWQKNLILDIGLDSVAAQVWADETKYCHAGSGTNPFTRDSGAITFTSAGTALVASAGFFEAADVGRLFKPDTGSEVYITAFTDAQNVTTNADPGAVASQGTIWYVNRTALQTELKRTLTVRTSGGDNGTTYSGTFRNFVYRRTHLFSAEVGAVTYREVGWGQPNTTTLFSGLVLSSADSLTAGQQYMVISELTMTPSPTTSVAQANVGSGGWDSSGNINIESIGSFVTNSRQIFSSVDNTGATFGGNPSANLEPAWQVSTPQLAAYLADFTLQSPSSTSAVADPSGTVSINSAASVYVPGQFFRDVSATWSVSQANGDWRGVGVHTGDGRCLSVRFTSNQTKDNTHTVTASFRFSWGRVLVN